MKRIATITICLLSALVLRAQNMTDLVISEVMLNNSASIVDDYGNRSPWIEILNTSQGMVNFAGCYFSDDPDNLTKSPILKGDNRTKLAARQTAVFFATGDPSMGTFYLNFELKPGSTLYLTSNDGHTVVDSIFIPTDIPEGMSISKFAVDNKEIEFTDIRAARPTPYSINGRGEQKSKAETIKETDPHGVTLTVVCVSVVFGALFILFIIYNLSGMFFSGKIKLKREKKEGAKGKAKPGAVAQDEIATAIALALNAEFGGETEAAIATALHLYLGDCMHDNESFIITIKPAASGWKNKTNFRKQPR
ncbi:MAG: OadG family transporter subunit [Bacteroidales bacterium]|nr:OadG family transporter subunit [Bacteroidales bacterium]